MTRLPLLFVALFLGPITGVFGLAALACLRRRQYGRAAICVAIIAGFWLAAPTILALEVGVLRGQLHALGGHS